MNDKTKAALAARFAGLEAIPLAVTVNVGRARCTLARLGSLKVGDVIDLDRRVGESFELLSDGVLLARVDPVAHEQGIAVKVVEIPEDDDDLGS